MLQLLLRRICSCTATHARPMLSSFQALSSQVADNGTFDPSCAPLQGMGLVLDAEGMLGSKRSKRCTAHVYLFILDK